LNKHSNLFGSFVSYEELFFVNTAVGAAILIQFIKITLLYFIIYKKFNSL
jgi:hypothetical protein